MEEFSMENGQNQDFQDFRISRIEDAMQHDMLTRRIIGCAMSVHGTLGNGFQEKIYQRALQIEMQQANLTFTREMEMPIFYKNIQIGTRRVDFFVENFVMVELKSLALLENVHLAQAKNYLEAYKMRLGLLINFGSTSLEFKRVFNKKH
jgi:GxxExxY protein